LVVKTLQIDRKTRVWLCAAAEVSLAEQNESCDTAVLLVPSSTASQFHFTLDCYFQLFNSRQLHYINFLQKEKPTIFKHVPLLDRLNMWVKIDGVSKIIM
jgi:hypothetical protein